MTPMPIIHNKATGHITMCACGLTYAWSHGLFTISTLEVELVAIPMTSERAIEQMSSARDAHHNYLEKNHVVP